MVNVSKRDESITECNVSNIRFNTNGKRICMKNLNESEGSKRGLAETYVVVL